MPGVVCCPRWTTSKRLHTRGGVALNGGACDPASDQTLGVPYTAVYKFYSDGKYPSPIAQRAPRPRGALSRPHRSRREYDGPLACVQLSWRCHALAGGPHSPRYPSSGGGPLSGLGLADLLLQ
jgi:hypothetical protein